MYVFPVYPNFIMKYLKIEHGHLSGVHCLILCLKLFRLSDFCILFDKSSHRTAPIVLIISKPNLAFLVFLLVTLIPNLKL